MDDQWRKLLEIIQRTSFQSERESKFRLASGRFSQHYVDCKQALSYPEARALIGWLIFDCMKGQRFDTVGGLELGAYPIASAVSDAFYQQASETVRAFVVRKAPKDHGIRSLLAGDVKKGDTALIVDDVITTGNSTIDAILRAREAGLNVDRVVVLVDRQEDDGRRNIEAHGVSCVSLFTLSDLIRAEAAETTNDRNSAAIAQAPSAQAREAL